MTDDSTTLARTETTVLARSQPTDLAAPVTQTERIIAIDVLRGMALLGILVMNIRAFASVFASYGNPTIYVDGTGIHRWVWLMRPSLCGHEDDVHLLDAVRGGHPVDDLAAGGEGPAHRGGSLSPHGLADGHRSTPCPFALGW